MLVWDEVKRTRNIQVHGFDFIGCERVFDGFIVTQEDDRSSYGEQRINLIGVLNSQIVHLTYTERGDDLRAISLRKATKHEIRTYFARLQS